MQDMTVTSAGQILIVFTIFVLAALCASLWYRLRKVETGPCLHMWEDVSWDELDDSVVNGERWQINRYRVCRLCGHSLINISPKYPKVMRDQKGKPIV